MKKWRTFVLMHYCKCNDERPSCRFTRVSFASDCVTTKCKIYPHAVLFMKNGAFFQTSISQFACWRKMAGMLVCHNIAWRKIYCNAVASSGATILSFCLSSFLPFLISAYSLVFRITGYQGTNSRNPDHTSEIRENPVVSLPPSCSAYVYICRRMVAAGFSPVLYNEGGMMRRRSALEAFASIAFQKVSSFFGRVPAFLY